MQHATILTVIDDSDDLVEFETLLSEECWDLLQWEVLDMGSRVLRLNLDVQFEDLNQSVWKDGSCLAITK